MVVVSFRGIARNQFPDEARQEKLHPQDYGQQRQIKEGLVCYSTVGQTVRLPVYFLDYEPYGNDPTCHKHKGSE